MVSGLSEVPKTADSVDNLDTTPKLLLRNYKKYGDKKVALREKKYGIWRPYTWKDYYENVKSFSLGLLSLGLQRGDKVTVIGDNRPQWFWAELGAQAIGAVVTGVFPDALPQEVKHIVGHSDSRFVVVKDQEQVDKLIFLKEELPKVEKVIFWDPKGLGNYKENYLIDFAKVQEIGRKYEREHPGAFEENVDKGKGSDLAVILYTSGTTKLPKGALITYHSTITAAKMESLRDPFLSTDQYLSFLPPCWLLEQAHGITDALYFQYEVNFPEEPETLMADMRELGPDILTLAPRIYEGMSSTTQAKITDTTFIKRQLYYLFLPVGYKVADFFYKKQKTPIFWKIMYSVANAVLFRQLRDKLGLSNVRTCYSGGGALGEDIFRFFRAIGINIKQVYGATEAQIITNHTDGDVKFETVGTPMPGVELKISDTGEIIVKHDALFSGYYKDPEATSRVMKDGWWRTGDAGFIDEDGHLICIDRADDVMKLPDGAKFSPTYIENRLKYSQYIRDAVILGGGDRPFITAIIDIDFDNVGRWAESKRIAYTTFSDLSQKLEIYDLIEHDVQRANHILPAAVKISRFVNLHKELDPDEAELTRTRKIRRSFFEEHYKSLVDALYGEAGNIEISSPVKYRDGRVGITKTTVTIRSLDKGSNK